MSEPTLHKFYVQLPIRIDWSEMDLFGHINNVMYFKYIQASRVNYWEQIGLFDSFKKNKIGAILASTKCNFIKPLHYPENIIVQVRMDYIKTSSFALHHQIMNAKNEIAAEAHDVMVMYDFNANKKIEFSQQLKEIVTQLEHKSFL
jgi:acyl-CoA thioester hydrolase